MAPDVQSMFESIGDKIRSVAKVETVFGQPVQMGDRTVIPVAKVSYGFGAGGGSGGGPAAEQGREAPPYGEGGGGGGGITVKPVGYLVESEGEIRYAAITDVGRVVKLLGAGVLLGLLLARRGRRAR